MSKPWFRLYAEFISDPKMQLLAFEDQRHYIGILCLKCNGTLETLSIGPEHFERMVSKALGLDPATGAEVKRRLMEIGVITESWQPIAWSRRQYESDSSAARTFQYRQRLRDAEQPRDVTVTDKNRSDSEQIQNRTDTEHDKSRAARSTASRFAEDFLFTPERQRVAEAERIDGPREFAKFADYWRSASGAKARKLDWDATWRNWCREAADRGSRSGRRITRDPKTPEQIEAEAARAQQ